MDKELDRALQNPDFLCLSGSRLYGTHRGDSDYDYRGVVIPPEAYLLGAKNFDCWEKPGVDHKIYSLHRFLNLVMGNDSGCLEMLFVPLSMIVRRNRVWDFIQTRMLPHLLSSSSYNRLVGYSYSEFRKAEGVKLETTPQSAEHDNLLNTVKSEFNLDDERYLKIREIALSGVVRSTVPSINNLGAKRKKEFEVFGFGVSSATHAIRLLMQCEELLLTGNMTFPLKDRDLLTKIRRGHLQLSQVKDIYERYMGRVKVARDKTVLPDRPDRDRVMGLYGAIVKHSLIENWGISPTIGHAVQYGVF